MQIDSPRVPIMTELTAKVGFGCPMIEKKQAKRRSAGIALIATLALAVSLVIAATAVSIGVARAQALDAVAHSHGMPAIAASLGLVMAGMGGVTLAGRRRRARLD